MRRFRQRLEQGERSDMVPMEVEAPKVPTEEEMLFLEAFAQEITEDLKALRARVDQLKGGGQ